MRHICLVLFSLICISNAQLREVRGAWIATVTNIDWPPTPQTPVADQQAALIKILDQAQAFGLNQIFFQVRPESDALYQSSIEPWSRYLTGTQGLAPNPLWDPLTFAIQQAHSRNMELHAWLNPYRAAYNNTQQLAPNHIAVLYPQYAYPYGQYLWMDPGAQVVQGNTLKVIIDIATRYNVDGIHFDDYFYPYPITGVPFPDNATYNDYLSSGGTMDLADWRRNNVNVLIQTIQSQLDQIRPDVKFGISPFGIWKPGYPPGITGLSSYDSLYADSLLWLQSGWVDYLAPQLYWPIESTGQNFSQLLQWWINMSYAYQPVPRQVLAGVALYRHFEDPADWPFSEYLAQINLCRQYGAAGAILFSISDILDADTSAYFEKYIYNVPALPPTMDWVVSQKPSPPINFQYNSASQTLSWQFPPNSTADVDEYSIRSWSLYKLNTTDSLYYLFQILYVNVTSYVDVTGTSLSKYALASVNGAAVESQLVLNLN